MGTRRLKMKESDRGVVMSEELDKFGIKALVSEDKIVISEGKPVEPKSSACSHNDHRIVMALSLLLSVTGGRLTGEQAVNKSFPDFFETIKNLGVEFQYEE